MKFDAKRWLNNIATAAATQRRHSTHLLQFPRLMVAGTHSGSGKTTLAMGLYACLLRRQLSVQAAKVGPDYIDPMFYRTIAQTFGTDQTPQQVFNLDTWLLSAVDVQQIIARSALAADFCLIEGVMGYYDGRWDQPLACSSYEIAQLTKTPVVLVVDGKGSSLTLAAVIQGLLAFQSPSGISGVILNRVSSGQYRRIKPMLEQATGIPILGYLPQMGEIRLPSRHLGLVLPHQIDNFQQQLQHLAEVLEETLDWKGLFALANLAPPVSVSDMPVPRRAQSSVVIGVALDDCFNFYYDDALLYLCECGATLLPFSPLTDTHLPETCDGLYFGGGYPELYAQTLSNNASFISSLRERASCGIPIMAECGGYMYLGKSLRTRDGQTWPMVGLVEHTFCMTGRLAPFGYVQIQKILREQGSETMAWPYGFSAQNLRGHCFHYSVCSPSTGDIGIQKTDGRTWREGHLGPGRFLSYVHLHFRQQPEWTAGFMASCRAYRQQRLAQTESGIG